MERTYVRRRRTAAAILAIAVLALGSPVAGASLGSGATGSVQTYVVRDGDTLWAIAERIAPSSDPRAVVYELERLNELDAASLIPGDTITLPDVG